MSCEVVNKIGTGDCELGKNCKSEQTFANVIASELVSEIIENALDIVEETEEKNASKEVGDILENLSNKFQELVISEEDHRMEKVEERSCSLPLKGLGDQLKAGVDELSEETPVRHPPVEKKNRLTDLVKNSKHLLAKLIMNENKDTSQEAKPEKIVRVVDLDSGDPPFKNEKVIVPEKVPLPRCNSEDILKASSDDDDEDGSMDEIQLCDKDNVKETYDKKTMTFPLATTSSGKTLSLAARCRTLKFSTEIRRKKWNFGTKIANYIRKHGKKESSEKKVSSGIEITPDPEK